MKIQRTSTGIIIQEPTREMKEKVLQYLSLRQPIREFFVYCKNDPSRKNVLGIKKDVLYLPSGFGKIPDEYIKKEIDGAPVLKPSSGAVVDIRMNREPRSPLQEDCIKHLTTSTAPKITVELKPGTGKTFISLYSISKVGLKPLIVTPTTLLKNQWIDNLVDLGISKDDITTDIYSAPSKTFCVVTITSIENAIRDDWSGLLKVIDEADFGIKIVDEAHLHLKGMLKLDSISNIKHNWYLSATLGRSDMSEDRILNRALCDAERFVGNAKYEEYQKEYVNVYTQEIKYYPTSRMCNAYFKYGKKGLIRATYYNMLMDYHNGVPFINNILTVTKRARDLVPYEARTIVLVPLLKTMAEVLKAMKNDPYFCKFRVAGVDGSLSVSKKREALDSDIIISTTMSMGVGVDIDNLGSVVNFDQYASLISQEQVIGRLRDRNKETVYVDVCDHVKYAKCFERWAVKRRTVMPYFPGVATPFKVLPVIHST
jgi:superfamily II DNA or RNA helicase